MQLQRSSAWLRVQNQRLTETPIVNGYPKRQAFFRCYYLLTGYRDTWLIKCIVVQIDA